MKDAWLSENLKNFKVELAAVNSGPAAERQALREAKWRFYAAVSEFRCVTEGRQRKAITPEIGRKVLKPAMMALQAVREAPAPTRALLEDCTAKLRESSRVLRGRAADFATLYQDMMRHSNPF